MTTEKRLVTGWGHDNSRVGYRAKSVTAIHYTKKANRKMLADAGMKHLRIKWKAADNWATKPEHT